MLNAVDFYRYCVKTCQLFILLIKRQMLKITHDIFALLTLGGLPMRERIRVCYPNVICELHLW